MKLSVWHERSERTGTYSVRYYDPASGLKQRVLCRDKETMRGETARITSMLLNYKGGTGEPDLIPLVAFESYLAAMKAEGLRDSTLEMKRFSLTSLLNSVFKLSDLSNTRIKHWQKELERYAVDTQAIRLRDLRALLNWLVKEGKLKESPFKGINVPASSFVGRRLTLEEIQKLYSLAHGDLLDFMVIALETGARRNEILSMSALDVDLAQKSWTIPAHKCKTRIQRTLPLSEGAYNVVKRRFKPAMPIFEGVTRFQIQKAFKRALRAAGIDGRVRLHDLRHTFASSWQGRRSTLKAMCGWKGEQMLSHYTHVDLNEMREDLARGKFGANLGQIEAKHE